MEVSLHETAIAQETVYEEGDVRFLAFGLPGISKRGLPSAR